MIENLNQQEADIVFIKNIDNVVPDHLKKTTVRWKQVLAGVLVEQQRLVFDRLRDPNLSEEERTKLRRPIRVCGVVKNTGTGTGSNGYFDISVGAQMNIPLVLFTYMSTTLSVGYARIWGGGLDSGELMVSLKLL